MNHERGLGTGERVMGLLMGLGKGRLDGTDLGRRAYRHLRAWEENPDDVQALQSARALYRESLWSIPKNHVQRVELMDQLAACHRNLWIATGDLGDLRVALELMEECLHLTPAHDVREWAERGWSTMLIHVLRYGATNHPYDVQRADAWRRALAPFLTGPNQHPWEPDVRAAVCLAEAQLAAVRGDAAACAEFVGRARQILGGSVSPTGGRAVETWSILLRRRTRFLLTAYERTYDEEALAEALTLVSFGIDTFGVAPGTPATLLRFRGRLRATHYRLHRRRDVALLARHDFEASLALAESSPAEPRAHTQLRLAQLLVLLSQHEQLDAADAAQLHDLALESLAGTAPGSMTHAECLVVGADIRRGFAPDGSVEPLREAVGLYEQALSVLRDTAGIAWEVHNRLSLVLRDLYKARGNPEHLDNSIDHAKRALELCPEREVRLNSPLLHATLGELLRVRYERFARHADYDQALHHTRQGVDLSPYPGSAPQWAIRVANHAIVVGLAGGVENLHRAEDLLLEALRHDDLGPWERTHLHHTLGATMRESARATQDREQLRTAILHLQRAEASASEGAGLSEIRHNLALALHGQWQLEHRPAALDEAHDIVEAALADTPPGSPIRLLLLSDLGSLLIARASQRLGLTGPGNAEVASTEAAGLARKDLERAVDVLEKARDEPGVGPAERGLFATQYGEALSFLGRLTDDPGLIEESLRSPREAVRSLDEEGPHWVLPAVFLAEALVGDEHGSNEDRHEAAELYGRLARHPMAAPVTRWRAAVARARILTGASDWAGALDAYSTAIAALPQMAWGGLDFDDQLNVLSNTSQTVSDAAAVALEAGAPERALELLEHGRSLLLSYALDMRTDLDAIRRRAPELAADLALSRDDRTSGRVRGSDDVGVRRRQSQRRWDRLVEQVRRQSGLADFLEPLSYQELLDTSRHGPVVVLNSSSLRTDALILYDGQLKVAPLPRFRYDKAVLRADALARSVHRAGSGEKDLLVRRPYLTDVLDWLWTAVAEPVLRVLSQDPALDAVTAPPRIWLCPTGVFNRLPVHAATRLPNLCEPDDKGADSLADRFVVSHTPTLRALRTAREEADRAHSRTTSPVLLVGVGKEPPYTGLPALRHVALEINAVARLLPAARELRDQEAVREAVVRHLRAGGWLHFAGHGEQDIANPDGVLYLWDHFPSGSLRIRDIAGLHLEQANLAYLSACETHRSPTAHSDEPVSLAGALQLAGYRHVVASQWQLNSRRASRVARDFYETLLRSPDGRTRPSGPEAANRSAYALHTAVGILRARRPEAVDMWAAYVHIGP